MKKPMDKGRSFANHEIVVLAVYLLGGDAKSVDTEDIAVKANELSPGRFSWRKYPEQINIETVRKRLWDAVKQEKGALIIGSERTGWTLTPNGQRIAKGMAENFKLSGEAKKRFSLPEKQWLRAERERMLSTEAFAKFNSGRSALVTKQEAEQFFRIDDYVVGAGRERKLARILNAFGEDPELGLIVKDLAEAIQARSKNDNEG